jgi:CheY-like chemotaxis protein
VDDGVDAMGAEGMLERGAVEEIAVDEARGRGDRIAMAATQVVVRRHVVPRGDERLADHAPDVSGAAGVQHPHGRAAPGPTDVVVSDIGMPREDGYWLIREVQTRVGSLPAIAVTGFSDRYHPKQAHDAGFREYLNKPVDPERLCGAVAKVLDRVG